MGSPMKTIVPECQWCGNSNTYVAGHSQFCVETQYKCHDCGKETWQDDRNEAN